MTVDTLANGAIVVRNGSEGLWRARPDKRWRVVEALRIGRATGSGPEVFGRIGSILVDDLGRIWIADQIANYLKVFSAGGEFVRTVGREGPGPGEFEDVGRVFRGPDGWIWVSD